MTPEAPERVSYFCQVCRQHETAVHIGNFEGIRLYNAHNHTISHQEALALAEGRAAPNFWESVKRQITLEKTIKELFASAEEKK